MDDSEPKSKARRSDTPTKLATSQGSRPAWQTGESAKPAAWPDTRNVKPAAWPDTRNVKPAAWPFGSDSDTSLLPDEEEQLASPKQRVRVSSVQSPGFVNESTVGSLFGVDADNATEDVDPSMLPPPSSVRLKKREVHLRREESVLADIAAARGGTLNNVRSQSMAALRRFESLPRKKQLLWVTASYIGVVLLVLVLYNLPGSQSAGAVTEANASVIKIADKPNDQAPKAPTPQAAPSKLTELAEPSEPSKSSKEAEQVQATPVERPVPVIGAGAVPATQTAVVPIRASLFVRQDASYKKAAKLRAGARLTIFTNFPTDEGWVLAKSEKGTIGFLPAANLDGQRDPRIEPPKNQRRKRRRR